MTSSTNASVVTSPATTSSGVGVEYTSTTSKGPIDTCFETGGVHAAASGQQHRRRHGDQADSEDQTGHLCSHQP